MKVVKKLGMAALGCLCVGLSIGNINTAHAGKGIHEDPTGKAYEKVKGDRRDKIRARYSNMEQAIETEHWEKVEEYTDPARTKNYKKSFLKSVVNEEEGLLVLAFDKALKSKSTNSMNILLRLLDTTIFRYKRDSGACLAKSAKEESGYTRYDVSGRLWRALCNLDEDDAIKIVQTLGKHGVKCDNVVDTRGYGKVSILDVSLLNGRTKLYQALLESGVNEFHVKEVMDVYVQKLFQLKPGDSKSYNALVGNYKPWVDEYRKTVDKQTFYSNVTGFIKTKEAEHEKKKQEELAKKKAEQEQKALESAWRNAFEAGDIAKIREIKKRGYEPYYDYYGYLGVISDQFLKNLVICEYKGEPHKSAEEALEFLEQLVNEKLTTWNKIFWNIGCLNPYLNEEECVEESEILCEIAKGVAKKGGKVNSAVNEKTPIGYAAYNCRVCPVRALLAAGSDRNPFYQGERLYSALKNKETRMERKDYKAARKCRNILAVLEEDRG